MMQLPEFKSVLKKRYVLYAGAFLLICGLAFAGTKMARGSKEVTLPEGTAITVALDHSVSSGQDQSGQQFDATVIAPVVLDGKVVIPDNARARGRIVSASSSGRLEHPGSLRLTLDQVQVNDTWYDLDTTSVGRRGVGHKKNNWAWIGGGAGFGTLLGALAGGGKGAAIGAPLGAGAGVGMAALTGKRDVRFPAESRLTFRLTQPVSIPLRS